VKKGKGKKDKRMKVSRKLTDFFERTGLRKNWFAKQLGISNKYFYQIVNGNFPLPKPLWHAVVELTDANVTLSDILEDFLDFSSGLNFQGRTNGRSCVVSLIRQEEIRNDKDENKIQTIL
jgi:hypothetical protein